MAVTAGYDVGGAHLKVALVESGRTITVEQISCPLWQGLDKLDTAFLQAAPLVRRASRHAITMTGELCEIFPDRRSGVLALIDRLLAILGPGLRVWMGQRGFASADEARREPSAVASMNFLASAELVARRWREAILIDMGSTTTDIIPVLAGRARPCGLTDGERLATGELVYTGLTRTDVASVAHTAPFQGRTQRLAAGNFATMADVRRILGELPEGADQHETADRRGKSLQESVARFARCFGRDAGDAALQEWRDAARSIANRQMHDIEEACTQVLSALSMPQDAPVIAAGIGAPLVAELASRLDRPCHTFGELANATDACRPWATRCAPAVAIALLADSE